MNQYFNKLLAPVCTCGIQNKIVYYPVLVYSKCILFPIMCVRVMALTRTQHSTRRRRKSMLRATCFMCAYLHNRKQSALTRHDIHMIRRECCMASIVCKLALKGEIEKKRKKPIESNFYWPHEVVYIVAHWAHIWLHVLIHSIDIFFSPKYTNFPSLRLRFVWQFDAKFLFICDHHSSLVAHTSIPKCKK